MIRLLEADVDRYGPIYDWRPPFEPGVTVLSGPNEAGKTLYLEALLQLLEPSLADGMEPPPRVEIAPEGRVVLEAGDAQYALGPDRRLSDVTPIEPTDLETVFVVRDEDLALPEGGGYYRSLVERLGDVHTSAIANLRQELRELGRLTEKRLDLSDQFDDAKSTRSTARSLRNDVTRYLEETVDPEGLDELQATRLTVERDRRAKEAELAEQRDAKTLAEYETLSDRLSTFEDASNALDRLPDVDRSDLEEIKAIDRDLADAREARADREAELASATRERDAARDELSSIERREARLDRRADAVDTTRQALETYRRTRDHQSTIERLGPPSRRGAVAAFVGAGISGAGGAMFGSPPAMAIGLGLLLIGLVAAGFAYRDSSRVARVERAHRRVLEAARDAGLSVEAIDEVPQAIESFVAERESTRDRRIRTASRVETLEGDIAELEATLEELDAEIDRLSERLSGALEAADVESVGEFADLVERRSNLEHERSLAAQALREALGEPDVDDPDAAIDVWSASLERSIADVDRSTVTPAAYDPDRLDRLEEEVQHLRHRRESLRARLEAYDRRMDRFAERLHEVDAGPFDVDTPTLDGRSAAALRTLRSDLDALIEAIDRDAELSRRAIEIFDGLAEEEERKLTDLFAPDGPASRALARITDGRYDAIGYDPDGHRLTVTRRDGRTFPAERLSSGTRDQLYFASRVALARHVLGDRPGFFLLDDPFVGADPDRLARGFETLVDLASDGWQVIYLTAKGEVRDDMVDRFELAHVALPSIA